MGTQVTITVYAPDRRTGQAAIDAAFQRMAEIEKRMSHYLPDSDVSRINAARVREPVKVSSDTFRVLLFSVAFASQTGGAFDITVGPLVQLWRKAGRSGEAPSPEALARARRLVDFRQVFIHPAQPNVVEVRRAGIRIDLGGIAKGYAVDAAIETLRQRGIRAALVEAGGDLYGLGAPPGRPGWVIGVRHPRRLNQLLPSGLLIKDRAVCTSGDYERFVEIEGREYSHIVDPRTGRPASEICSATVIAPDATGADALATAVSVLGAGDGIRRIDQPDLPLVEAMVIRVVGNQIEVRRSRGFARFEQELK